MSNLVKIVASKKSLAERPVQPEVILSKIVEDPDPL
jgi:hypothetical protein